MDGADAFFGLAVIAFAALITVAAHWKEWMGRDIARRSQSQNFIDIYEEAKRERTRSAVQQRSQGGGTHIGSWTPEDGNLVGYYGRLLWLRLHAHYTREGR